MSPQEIIYLIGASLMGLVVGSFLNVCIYRIPLNISVNGNKGRSMCPKCKHNLAWFDLFPLFSYLFLKGKCRYCKTSIHWRYPLVEFLNALLWTITYLIWGLSWQSIIFAVYFSTLIVISGIDIDTKEIPYRFQVVILVLAGASFFLTDYATWQQRLLGCVVISLPMVILTLVFGGFGGGDIQLMATSGLLLGWKPVTVGMFAAVLCAGVFSLLFLRKRGRKYQIPFGPYLAIGLMIGIFGADAIINWYMNFF